MASIFSAAAPKTLFENHFISNDSINPIKVQQIKEYESDTEYILCYSLNNTIQIVSLIALLKALETNCIRLAYCNCRGYDDNGFRYYCRIKRIEELKDLDMRLPSFDAVFCTRETLLYSFSITADINSSNLFYSVKLADLGKPLHC